MHIILKAENISYSIKQKTILSGISFEIKKGEKLGISGESGSGKTTIAKLIAGIIKPPKGTISLNFNQSSKTRPMLLVLFQNNGELIHPFRKARDIIYEAVKKKNMNNKSQIESEIECITSMLNISPELLDRKGCQLSGGEQQRIGLARLLALQPELLIVDEPFSSQDPESSENIINVLNNFAEKTGMTLISISHDLKSLSRVSDEIMILYQGEIIEKNATSVITKDPVHPYTQFLLKASNYNLKAEDFIVVK